MMSQAVIGILTWRSGTRFSEPAYLRRLVRAGRELGAIVYLFSYQDAHPAKRQIYGFVPGKKGGWVRRWLPWPDMVIDRYRKRVPAYIRFRHRNHFPYANSTFSKKWKITKLLADETATRPWIPETVDYSKPRLLHMLRRHPLLYVKPGNGTGGRSILKVAATAKGYHLQGRDKFQRVRIARFASESATAAYVERWVHEQKIQDGPFMVQQGLQLSLLPNRVADVRLLIQKDERGEWDVTGLGVRVGAANSSTSNLHGGGRAIPFERFMKERFGERAEEIRHECCQLAYQTASTLERHFGRMIEFGLDIGIDVDGKVWLIEVNPKPGREIFREMGQLKTYRLAIRRPVQYAIRLAQDAKRRTVRIHH
ncbi:MAG TPA: YheC/YheD family protein [Candidatus Bathyarchaeia archaeon]|nr:YheC/YheD family protein [Candidatus Bathyarchaeia archaeon]